MNRSKSQFKKALRRESQSLAQADVPILTTSATFRKELSYRFGIEFKTKGDLIYSRAHYSMAEAVRQKAKQKKLSSYLADPINYVNLEGWDKVNLVEEIGKLAARNKLLKKIKSRFDTLIRGKSPIRAPIELPLKNLASQVNKPIICLHYEVANLLASSHQLVCVVTDPHVRLEYLKSLPEIHQINQSHPNFAVFDQQTKKDFLSLAKKQAKFVDAKKVVVTGPPIDPRILKIRYKKELPKKDQPINLAVTTGGLGQSLNEIKKLLNSLASLLRKPEN